MTNTAQLAQVFNFTVKGGGEGPSHDPYHYDEYRFEYRSKKYVIHMGLAQWIEVDGKHISATEDVDGINFYDECEKFIDYVIGDGFQYVLESMLQEYYGRDKGPAWY